MAEQSSVPITPGRLREQVKEIVSRISRIDPGELQDRVLIREELGIDSLMAMEIVATCEKKLGIAIDEGKLFEIQTVGDFFRLVEEIYDQKWVKKS